MTTHRKCGDCQLCCRLLPTEEIGKLANVRCEHQCRKGCRIYDHKPMSCTLWNCRWLVNDDTHDQPRPDRSHIVLDIMPDVLTITDEHTGEQRMQPCIVAWVDPNHRDAWQAPAFRAYVERQTLPVLLRLSNVDSIGVLFPPSMTGLDKVAFKTSQLGRDTPMTLQEKAAALGAVLEVEAHAPGEVKPMTLRMPDGTSRTVGATTALDVLRVPEGNDV